MAAWAGVLGLALAPLGVASSRIVVDFTSTAGLHATCAQLSSRPSGPEVSSSVMSDQDKLALVVCTAVEQTQHIWRLPDELKRRFGQTRNILAGIRAEALVALAHVRASRGLLESIHLDEPAFIITPGEWQLDIDGDGELDGFERHFFWLPRPDLEIPTRGGQDPDVYYPKYFHKPQIRIDQSDIHWAIAYCHIAEAALNVALGYEPRDLFGPATLKEPWRLAAAHDHALRAIEESRTLRAALLAETDDDREWIPNPTQQNNAFPLLLDDQVFTSWAALLTQLDELLHGKTLLAVHRRNALGDLLPPTFRCPEGQGISIKKLFDKPVVAFDLFDALEGRCEHPRGKVTLSDLHRTVEEIRARSPGGLFSARRYLYWIN